MDNQETSDTSNAEEFEKADGVGPVPTSSEDAGRNLTRTDIRGNFDGQSQTPTDRQHVLTTNEALGQFDAAGLSRSQRSIERYCADGKLDCVKDPDEGRHYITPESVDRLIAYLKELQARHGLGSMRTVEADKGTWEKGAEKAASKQHGDYGSVDDKSLRAKVERIQREAAFKDMYIEKLEEERENDKERLVDLGRQVGELRSELRLLAPPSYSSQRESLNDADNKKENSPDLIE